MWPLIYGLGMRFSRWMVLPAAAVVGTVGYYVEKKWFPKPKKVPYLTSSVQEQREKRLSSRPAADPHTEPVIIQLPNTLGVNKPRPVEKDDESEGA